MGTGNEQRLKEGYYLQDARTFVGNDMLWWAEGNNGYTTDLRRARIYSEAEKRRAGVRETDVFWPVGYINSISRPVADHQHAKREGAEEWERSASTQPL